MKNIYKLLDFGFKFLTTATITVVKKKETRKNIKKDSHQTKVS